MHKNTFLQKFHGLACVCCMVLLFLLGSCDQALGAPDYQVVLEDNADLLTDSEEEDLKEIMQKIAEYGNVALVTIDYNPNHNTERFAESYNEKLFGRNGDAVLFVIDMDERYIYIDSMGSMRKTISSAYANTITDNVYSYASAKNYYQCAYKAFDQMRILLEGRHIAQPMKYVSNALLAMIAAMIINFFAVSIFSKKHKPSKMELLSGIYHKAEVANPRATFVNQTKTYSPQSSGGGGGGGGGHSGGGGGGGHSGGGHRF